MSGRIFFGQSTMSMYAGASSSFEAVVGRGRSAVRCESVDRVVVRGSSQVVHVFGRWGGNKEVLVRVLADVEGKSFPACQSFATHEKVPF
jgi:hypothetical protein